MLERQLMKNCSSDKMKRLPLHIQRKSHIQNTVSSLDQYFLSNVPSNIKVKLVDDSDAIPRIELSDLLIELQCEV